MKRVAAFLALALMIATVLTARTPSKQFQINVDVDLVNVNFSALDKNGRMVTGLTADDFIVEEDGRKQKVALFSRERELPLTLALLMDISPSVEPVFNDEKRTAAAFLESVLGKRDLALVMSFDKHVTLVQDYSEDIPTLKDAIDGLLISKPGGTSLYDAVYLAAEEKMAKEAGRKAIVVMSDGDDSTSRYDLGKAMIAVQKSNAVVYTISNSGNPRSLRSMAGDTGGASFKVDEKGDLEKIFDQISNELRTQYFIGYHSTNPVKDGRFRQIKITPKNSRLMVRARKGYYAPTEANGR
jgi:VWFA-related protein